MPVGGRKDPYLSYNFLIEVDKLVIGGFNEVSGLQSESEIQEFREGGVNGFMHKRAGPIKYTSNLILKRGIAEVGALWPWYCDVVQGKVERKTVSVLLLDSSAQEQMRWDFQRAYPVRWGGASFRAASAEIAVETIEMAHDGLAPPRSRRKPSASAELGVGISGSASLSVSGSASFGF